MNEVKLLQRPPQFSLRARMKSFAYAWSGIRSFFHTEPNARLHLASTSLVIIAAILVGVDRREAVVLVFAMGFVWVTEIINTAIEKAMDFISGDYHPAIKTVKDLAAGAVLVASVTALVAGLIIFIPKILSL
jgi:diacylglycerol kinase (ATP)